MGQSWQTCDPRIRSWVDETVADLAEELGPSCVGAYLHGSLASGSFYPPKSDVDLLFVAASKLAVDERRSFAEECVRLHAARPIVGGLECSVILTSSAAAPVHPMPFEVHFAEGWVDDITEGRVDHDRPGTDPDLAAHCQATLEFGVPLYGRPVADVFGPVRMEDFVDAIRGDLEWILADENLLESPVYGVLNSCRVLWLWSDHSPRLVPSKEEAALWALETVAAELRPPILVALRAYRDDAPIRVEDRRAAGRTWERESVLAFRDWMRSVREDHPSWGSD